MASTELLMTENEAEKTLIVVFLRGGADGLNMVVPVEDHGYYRLRPQLGIPKNETVLLDNIFGLHPLLAPLQPAFSEGDLLFVHGAGSEDQTRSHFEAQDSMEHGGLAAGGWLGRFLRNTIEDSAGPLSAVAIGKTQPEVLRGAPSCVAFESLNVFDLPEGTSGMLPELQRLYGADDSIVGAAGRDAMRALNQIEDLRQSEYRPAAGAEYPAGKFGDGLRHVAQLIKAGVGLRAASVDLDGWDAHFTAATLMAPLLRQLAEGLAAFRQDLGTDMGRACVVVMSEFGRRAYENASFGTDHGRGGLMFVMGGKVKGGRVLASWPGLTEEHLEEPGDVPVAYNYRDVLAPVLSWHSPGVGFGSVFPDYAVTPVQIHA